MVKRKKAFGLDPEPRQGVTGFYSYINNFHFHVQQSVHYMFFTFRRSVGLDCLLNEFYELGYSVKDRRRSVIKKNKNTIVLKSREEEKITLIFYSGGYESNRYMVKIHCPSNGGLETFNELMKRLKLLDVNLKEIELTLNLTPEESRLHDFQEFLIRHTIGKYSQDRFTSYMATTYLKDIRKKGRGVRIYRRPNSKSVRLEIVLKRRDCLAMQNPLWSDEVWYDISKSLTFVDYDLVRAMKSTIRKYKQLARKRYSYRKKLSPAENKRVILCAGVSENHIRSDFTSVVDFGDGSTAQHVKNVLKDKTIYKKNPTNFFKKLDTDFLQLIRFF